MTYKWILGIPLLFAMVLFFQAGWQSIWPMKNSSSFVLMSPFPSQVPEKSPAWTMITPCEMFSVAQLTEITQSNYLTPRLSANQRIDGLLMQKCLWLATDEHLTPTITVTIVSTESASASAVTEYWQKYKAQNQNNSRFRSLEMPNSQAGFVDSWGIHLKFTEAVVTVQASMPNPNENQSIEQRLLEVSLPQLSKFYSLDQNSDESVDQ